MRLTGHRLANASEHPKQKVWGVVPLHVAYYLVLNKYRILLLVIFYKVTVRFKIMLK